MRRIVTHFERGLLAIATLALIAMMLSISADALGRYLFNSPFRGNFELTSLYFMVILVFATLSHNYAKGVHVRLDIISGYLSRRFGKGYTRLVALICLPVFGYFAWHAGVEALDKIIDRDTRMGAIPFPLYLSYVWVALGSMTLSLRFAMDLIAPEDLAGSGDHAAPEKGA